MDKDLFLKARLPERELDVPGVGTVRIRGLSRAEILAAQALTADGAMERFVVAAGLVDPQLTEDEVDVWRRNVTHGEVGLVFAVIEELSGLGEDAAKAEYKSV